MFNKLKFIFLFLIILIFIPILANAQSFEVTAEPIVDAIVIDEDAIFKISIENTLNSKQEFRIYTLDFPFWDIRTDPIVNPITLEVNGDSTKSIELMIDPLHITQIGAFIVNINVQSLRTKEIIMVPVQIGIKSTEPLIGGYIPTVVTSVSIPEKIDPREEIPIKINLNNQNLIDYDDMIIKFESNLINEEIEYQLEPKEEKTLTLKRKIDPLTKPQKDTFSVSVFKGDRLIVNPIVKPIEIIEYSKLNEKETRKRLLRTKKEFTFTSNDKNYKGKTRIETTLFKSLFTSTNPKSETVIEDGKRYIVWDISLQGSNSLNLTVTENLLPLFVILILIVVLIALYYSFRSPMTIRKEANIIKEKDGGISELKVILHVRNRSKSKLNDIHLSERVPHLVLVEKDISIGTLHPEKILRHENKDTIIKWNIHSLDAHEERVLAYKVSTMLPILGSFSLPATGSKFHIKDKVMVASSNRLSVEV